MPKKPLASCTTLVAMTSVPICVRIDGLKGITFLACLDDAEVSGAARVSSANWRQSNAMPASRNIGYTPVARLTSLKLGASPAISRRACDPPVGGFRPDQNSQNCHISDFMADLLDFGHLSSAS